MNKIYGFCHDDRGAYAILYAAMLPMIIGFFAFMINGCDILTTKARLNDAMNQGVYAVAVTDNRNKTTTDVSENNQLLMNYIKYYVGTRSDINNVHVVETVKQSTSVVYQGTAIINNHPVIMDQSSPNQLGMPHNTPTHNDSDTGIVKRNFISDEPIDLVFVVDSSGSMADPSMELGLSRFQLMQKVVHDFGNTILAANTKNKIGFVPFTTGVRVKLPGLDEVGNPRFGCSYAGALKPPYDTVDSQLWHDKPMELVQLKPIVGSPANSYVTAAQQLLNDYYINILGPVLNSDTAGLIAKGYCDDQSGQLVCNYHKNERIYSSGIAYNDALAQWPSALALYFALGESRSLLNMDTIDYNKTFLGNFLFTDKSIINWEINPSLSARFGFNMCSFIPFRNNNVWYGYDDTAIKDNNFLVDLSSNAGILDEISKMEPANYYAKTDTNSGLMRALPLIAKGTNPRKALVIISDGLDSYARTTSGHGPINFRDELHKNYHLCDFITKGLLNYPTVTKTKYASIFYIALINDSSGNAATKFWGDYCTGVNNAVVAEKYDSIMNFLKNATTPKGDNQLHFINKDGLVLP